MQDQDNVCAVPRQCVAGREYLLAEHRPASASNGYVGSDTLCAPYTPCDPRSEYLAVRGNATHDNRCEPVDDCTLPLDARYEASPPVDAAEAPNSVGRNAVCRNYTRCAPGSYPNASGTRTSDRGCAPCPPGSHGVADGERCEPCVAGETYAPLAGATACLACSACGDNATGIGTSWPNCSGAESCPIAYRSLCTLAADATCMRCPQPGWRLSGETRLCEPCQLGFLNDSRGECVACPADHYCPGPSTQRPCQGLRAFEAPPGVAHSVPRSPPGSVFASDCSCASTGGGFEGRADGLVGCTPCEDGHFYPPSEAWINASAPEPRCMACPAGTHAAR